MLVIFYIFWNRFCIPLLPDLPPIWSSVPTLASDKNFFFLPPVCTYCCPLYPEYTWLLYYSYVWSVSISISSLWFWLWIRWSFDSVCCWFLKVSFSAPGSSSSTLENSWFCIGLDVWTNFLSLLLSRLRFFWWVS